MAESAGDKGRHQALPEQRKRLDLLLSHWAEASAKFVAIILAHES